MQNPWQARWDEGRIGFHLSEVNPLLVRWWPRLTQGECGPVLVPLCGKSLDLRWLYERGHRVTGIEFVERAASAFFQEQGLSPCTESLPHQPGAVVYQVENLRIIVDDFFRVRPESLEPPRFVYDRAALVAIEPARRQAYVEKLRNLCPVGTSLLLINFVHDMPSGPPYSIADDDLPALFSDGFELEKHEDLDITADNPQFLKRGASFIREQVWLGRRVPS